MIDAESKVVSNMIIIVVVVKEYWSIVKTAFQIIISLNELVISLAPSCVTLQQYNHYYNISNQHNNDQLIFHPFLITPVPFLTYSSLIVVFSYVLLLLCQVDYHDTSKTENGRVSYPIYHIPNYKVDTMGSHPNNIFFLTCDAFGVLPPVSYIKNNTTPHPYHNIKRIVLVAGLENYFLTTKYHI